MKLSLSSDYAVNITPQTGKQKCSGLGVSIIIARGTLPSSCQIAGDAELLFAYKSN